MNAKWRLNMVVSKVLMDIKNPQMQAQITAMLSGVFKSVGKK